MSNSNSYNLLLNKIKLVSKKQNMIDFYSASLKLFTLALVLVFLASVIEYIAEGDSLFRTSLFGLSVFALIAGVGVFYNKLLLKVFSDKHKFNLDNYALKIGNVFPEIKDKLLNVLQLTPIKLDGTKHSFANSDLSESAFKVVFEQSKDKNFELVLDKNELKRSGIYFTIALLLNITLFGVFPTEMTASINRVVNYKDSYLPVIPFSIELEKNKYSFLRGEDLAINIIGKGELPKEITIKMKEKGQENYDEFSSKLIDGKYTFVVNSIKNDFEYYAEAVYYTQTTQTKVGKVVVNDLPIIKTLSGNVSLPYYARQSSFAINETNADITTLKGSLFNFEISSNKNLKSANLVFKPSLFGDSLTAKKPLNIDGNSAKGSLSIKENGEYYFEVTDESNNKSIQPIVYKIIALNDENPEIKLISPDDNVTVTEKAILPIMTQISDDYGFNKLTLNYRLSSSPYTQAEEKFTVQEISILSNDLVQEIPYVWDLNKLNIVPEVEYEFYLEIFDNDIVSGPKSSRTKIITLRLPSLDEVFAQSEQTQEEVLKDMSDLVKDTEKLKKDIDELQNDLRKEPNKNKVDWDKLNKAKDIVQKQEKLQDKFNEMQQKLEESTQKLQDNNVLSPETLEKFKELQKLMKEVATEEMKDKSRKMNEELKKMSPEEMKKAMEETKLDEETFKKQLERSMELLKKMQTEQKMDQLSKKAKEMEKQQEKLSEELNKKNLDKNAKEEIAKKQDKLKEEVKDLEKELAKLGENLKEMKDKELMEEFQKSLEDLNPENTKEQMQQAKENVEKDDKQQAKRNQQNAQKNLNKFSQQMQKMKQKMQQNQMQKAIDQMQKSISDAVKLSKQQEELRKKMQKLDHNSTQLPEIQKEQGKIKQSLSNVSKEMDKLSQESAALSPELSKEMANAMKAMSKSESELSERRTGSSANAQQEAMESLNKSVNKMQGAMSDMQAQQAGACQNPGDGGQGEGEGQGKGQGQKPSFSQQIQQAAAQQQMLQDALEKSMGKDGGAKGGKEGEKSSKEGSEGQSGESRKDGQSGDNGEGKNKAGTKGRLKNQIGEAQKSIQELQEEQKKSQNENSEKMAAELKEVSEQMKEILADVESGRISDKTLERQQKILSRLLDAYKSVNERDFSKERKSESSNSKNLVSPESLQLNDFERKRALEEMMKKMKLGYSKDYELLIKEYFQELNTEDGKNN